MAQHSKVSKNYVTICDFYGCFSTYLKKCAYLGKIRIQILISIFLKALNGFSNFWGQIWKIPLRSTSCFLSENNWPHIFVISSIFRIFEGLKTQKFDITMTTYWFYTQYGINPSIFRLQTVITSYKIYNQPRKGRKYIIFRIWAMTQGLEYMSTRSLSVLHKSMITCQGHVHTAWLWQHIEF